MIGTRKAIDAMIDARKAYNEALEAALYAEPFNDGKFDEYVSSRKIEELAKLLGLPVRRTERDSGTLLSVTYRTCTFLAFERKEVA